MCRSIKTFFNLDPPATSDEVRASSLQFVRKLSGLAKPSRANEELFNLAVEKVSTAANEIIDSHVTSSSPRDRKTEATLAKEHKALRFS